MDFSIDGKATKSSLSSLTLVAGMHVGLACALLFGLKTVSVTMPTVKELVEIVIPATPPRPLPPVTPPPVNRTSPIIDFPVIDVPTTITEPVHPPSPYDGPKTDYPPVAIEHPPVQKALDVLTSAVVDARSCDKPDYPVNALRNEFTGVVTLELLIGPDGRAGESKILQSSGHRDLDQAAIAGLRLCKFKPATLNGQPQKSWARLQYAWNLEGR